MGSCRAGPPRIIAPRRGIDLIAASIFEVAGQGSHFGVVTLLYFLEHFQDSLEVIVRAVGLLVL